MYRNSIGKETYLYPILEDGRTIAFATTRLGASVIAAKLNTFEDDHGSE